MAKKKAENTLDNTSKAKRKLPAQMEPYKWKPGECPNPGGRPKKKPVTEVFERIFGADDGAFVEEELRKVLTGKSAVAKVMLVEHAAERLEGKVTQPIEANINLQLSERLAKALERTRKR